ncbi:MAG: protein-export chaperone SecB [Proteobacteria bacterium]|nr:protein-export chaperone SecB [Pseudomonadota bacterium]
MTDSTNGSAGSAPGTAPSSPVPSGSPQQQAAISVNTQYVKDLSFENPNAPQSLVPQSSQPNIDVNVNVQARGLGPNVYEVVLSITCTAKHETMTAFIVEVAYAGVFTLTGVPAQDVHPILLIECPRLLFPFARALVANATREGGFLPLLIQPIDFLDLYRRQAAAQGPGVPPPTPAQGA